MFHARRHRGAARERFISGWQVVVVHGDELTGVVGGQANEARRDDKLRMPTELAEVQGGAKVIERNGLPARLFSHVASEKGSARMQPFVS